ncbi:MAG TPA: iron-containing redox enzyme family protein [Ferrovibrio sp.]|jgi:hypothetical protein|uniref:iron-containing redox enzyme family protein n=1 Tax=Ferrovibrio sp. TaxID=1917215 RepID=UPI002B4B1286|nr:iron-containing redox enzyme family protein [Ferrovibrio sp.]HLT79110.1 iron-containing redox enzyme family protein [Ferrovibrio sp.]
MTLQPEPVAHPDFERQQHALATFNHGRLAPKLSDAADRMSPADEAVWRQCEIDFVEAARAGIAPLLVRLPADADAFIRWYEALKDTGPGQGDALFPWLAESATAGQMRWFMQQEVAGEAGFDDLVALTQLRLPVRPKLEMARNYWDEMGRGNEKGMHGPMLERLAAHMNVAAETGEIVPEALALGNMMMALATNRHYAYQAIGALGVIELTAPTRAVYVNAGMKRLGVPARARHYFALHAVLDVQHSASWNREILRPLVAEDPRRARPIAEGALLRLVCGARCFERYRRHFGLTDQAALSA